MFWINQDDDQESSHFEFSRKDWTSHRSQDSEIDDYDFLLPDTLFLFDSKADKDGEMMQTERIKINDMVISANGHLDHVSNGELTIDLSNLLPNSNSTKGNIEEEKINLFCLKDADENTISKENETKNSKDLKKTNLTSEKMKEIVEGVKVKPKKRLPRFGYKQDWGIHRS